MIDLEAVKELLKSDGDDMLRSLHIEAIAERLVAEVEELREEIEEIHATGGCSYIRLAEANKETAGMALQINDLHTEKMKLLDQLSEANNLIANLQMDKDEMSKEVKGLKRLLLEKIFPFDTTSRVNDARNKYREMEIKLTTLTEQHAKAVECLKWYTNERLPIELPDGKILAINVAAKAKACLAELGVKDE